MGPSREVPAVAQKHRGIAVSLDVESPIWIRDPMCRCWSRQIETILNRGIACSKVDADVSNAATVACNHELEFGAPVSSEEHISASSHSSQTTVSSLAEDDHT